jgi:hypothetical protein
METQLNSKEKVSLSSLFVWAKDGVVDKDHPLESGSGNSKFPVNEVHSNHFLPTVPFLKPCLGFKQQNLSMERRRL